jgi:hypothetical protein
MGARSSIVISQAPVFVPNLTTSGSFVLANTGDEVILKDSEGTHVDSVVYEGGDPTDTLWFGPPISPYGGTSVGIERFAQQERDVKAFGPIAWSLARISSIVPSTRHPRASRVGVDKPVQLSTTSALKARVPSARAVTWSLWSRMA